MKKRKANVVAIIVGTLVVSIALLAGILSGTPSGLRQEHRKDDLDAMQKMIAIVGTLTAGTWVVYRYWLAPSDAWSVDLNVSIEQIAMTTDNAFVAITVTLKNVSSVRLHLESLDLDIDAIDRKELEGIPQCSDGVDCFTKKSVDCNCTPRCSDACCKTVRPQRLKQIKRITQEYIMEPNTTYIERFVEAVSFERLIQAYVLIRNAGDRLPIDVRQFVFTTRQINTTSST